MANKKEGNYLRLHRDSLKSSVFQNEKFWQVWCWCLMKASWSGSKFPFNGEDIELKKGQFITGRKQACKELKTTQSKYRNSLSYLQKTERISIKTTNRFSIITVLNWEKYQSDNLENDQQTTNKRPTNDQQTTPLKKVKKVKKVKKINYNADKSAGNQINLLLNEFDSVNPTTNYGNKTQRKVLEDMVKKWGYEKTLNTIKFAVSVQGKKYAPIITTPIQLKNKMGELLVFHKRESDNPLIANI